MKLDLTNYINGLRKEEVSNGPNSTCYRLLDESTLTSLHKHYKEYYTEQDPPVQVIELYKTFCFHFNILFPNLQLSKGNIGQTNKMDMKMSSSSSSSSQQQYLFSKQFASLIVNALMSSCSYQQHVYRQFYEYGFNVKIACLVIILILQ